ncbi:clavesin-1-like isoform X3 [Topomyia yanbarensis]|uniref:clavesin-1-like isoform X3 n=1 Tax=Topomyia yanbarensis TaxID=2498891 RepID=UPI00273CEFA9|nr:clavesin-1-like isoform X3 [Topomyia yanbarensis]
MPSVLSIEKRPSVYDEYRTTLEPKYLIVAREELNEHDHIRDQSLAQMRDFIAKHPQIVRCRTDAVFLLRFLRLKKFNVMAATEMLVKHLTFWIREAEFCAEIDPCALDPIIQQCAMVPLGQDSLGRLVVSVRLGQYDVETTSAETQFRLACLMFETYIDTEIHQVTGLVAVYDFQSATTNHFMVWTLPKLTVLLDVLNNIAPFRIREIHIVQLPKYAAAVAEFFIGRLSQKLKQRVKFHKTPDALKDAIDESILPTIYGGKQSLEEANEKFRQRAMQERERLLKQADMFIDLSIPSPNANNNTGVHSSVADEAVIGSFRKLNVD